MGEFFVYILKSSVCLSVLYLFYRLLLSRETFYKFNRIAILGILVISLALPFFEITIKQQTEVQQTVLTLEQLLLMADNLLLEGTVDVNNQDVTTALWIQVLLFIYMAGVVFFLFRNIYSLLQLMRLIHSSIRLRLQKGIWLVSHSNPKYSPFSWMNFIVMSHNDFEEENNAILVHEMAHIRKRHSIDLLITDVCIIFQWFNPAAWLFKQELQNIHEYQADEAVLDKGVNAKQYQLLLIKKAAGTRLYSMANSFNHSKLKKRITMMLKEKSNPWARLKYLYVLPVVAIAITAFARPEISNELKEISAVKVNDLTGIVKANPEQNQYQQQNEPATIPDINNSPGGAEMKEELPEKKDTIILAADKLISTGSATEGLSIIKLDGHRNSAIMTENMIEFTSASRINGQDDIQLTIKRVDTLKNDKKVWVPNFDMKGKPLYILDGEVVFESTINSLDKTTIESVSVLKSESALKKYGNAAENGVVVLETKGYHKKLDSPVIVIDDVRVTTDDLQQIDPNDIAAVSVIKFDKWDDSKRSLALKYDALDAEGVILVTTKEVESQNGITIKGTVKDEKGSPIIGASVLINGTNKGTISDLDGNFIINAPEDAQIAVMYIGMEAAIVKVKPELNVVLKSE